jgi:hypothetical protein
MDDRHGVLCLSCGSPMRPQIDRLDLNWAGDGPYARDDEFPGILAEVYGCACGRVAIRPVRIELSRSRGLDAPRAGAA